ncbi:MAG: hypothetical protein JO037_24080 [Actinobacteria bacterium]|nr:hypothetical protein [Actinomycetota bacterium]
MPASSAPGPRQQRRPPRRGQPRPARPDRSARPLLAVATVAALGLAAPAAWRWCRRTSRTQVHRVNQ